MNNYIFDHKNSVMFGFTHILELIDERPKFMPVIITDIGVFNLEDDEDYIFYNEHTIHLDEINKLKIILSNESLENSIERLD